MSEPQKADMDGADTIAWERLERLGRGVLMALAASVSFVFQQGAWAVTMSVIGIFLVSCIDVVWQVLWLVWVMNTDLPYFLAVKASGWAPRMFDPLNAAHWAALQGAYYSTGIPWPVTLGTLLAVLLWGMGVMQIAEQHSLTRTKDLWQIPTWRFVKSFFRFMASVGLLIGAVLKRFPCVISYPLVTGVLGFQYTLTMGIAAGDWHRPAKLAVVWGAVAVGVVVALLLRPIGRLVVWVERHKGWRWSTLLKSRPRTAGTAVAAGVGADAATGGRREDLASKTLAEIMAMPEFQGAFVQALKTALPADGVEASAGKRGGVLNVAPVVVTGQGSAGVAVAVPATARASGLETEVVPAAAPSGAPGGVPGTAPAEARSGAPGGGAQRVAGVDIPVVMEAGSAEGGKTAADRAREMALAFQGAAGEPKPEANQAGAGTLASSGGDSPGTAVAGKVVAMVAPGLAMGSGDVVEGAGSSDPAMVDNIAWARDPEALTRIPVDGEEPASTFDRKGQHVLALETAIIGLMRKFGLAGEGIGGVVIRDDDPVLRAMGLTVYGARVWTGDERDAVIRRIVGTAMGSAGMLGDTMSAVRGIIELMVRLRDEHGLTWPHVVRIRWAGREVFGEDDVFEVLSFLVHRKSVIELYAALCEAMGGREATEGTARPCPSLARPSTRIRRIFEAAEAIDGADDVVGETDGGPSGGRGPEVGSGDVGTGRQAALDGDGRGDALRRFASAVGSGPDGVFGRLLKSGQARVLDSVKGEGLIASYLVGTAGGRLMPTHFAGSRDLVVAGGMPASGAMVADLVVACVDVLRDSVVVDPVPEAVGGRGILFIGVLDGGGVAEVVRVVPMKVILENVGLAVPEPLVARGGDGRELYELVVYVVLPQRLASEYQMASEGPLTEEVLIALESASGTSFEGGDDDAAAGGGRAEVRPPDLSKAMV